MDERAEGRGDRAIAVGRSEPRVDGVKLATGRGTFVDDVAVPHLLHAIVLRSPHAHAWIRSIDASAARAIPGVACILTHQDVARVPYTTAGQGWPEPSPRDTVMLDRKVRFVGDRVAVVAAEDPRVARRACEAIRVDYEVLPSVLSPEAALAPGAPVIHDETDSQGIRDASRNLAAEVLAEVGSVERGFSEATHVLEATYRVDYVQQSSIEPHVAICWLDEDHRLTVRTSTQVPFHVRRILAPLLGISDRAHPRGQAPRRRRLRRQAGDPDRGPLRGLDASRRAAPSASSTPAKRSSPRRGRGTRKSSRSRPACGTAGSPQSRCACSRTPGLRHSRAHGDERDGKPGSVPLPQPKPALRGPRRLHEPGGRGGVSRLRLPAGVLRAGEPRRRGGEGAGRGPARVSEAKPRPRGRRAAHRPGARRRTRRPGADGPLLRAATRDRRGRSGDRLGPAAALRRVRTRLGAGWASRSPCRAPASPGSTWAPRGSR